MSKVLRRYSKPFEFWGASKRNQIVNRIPIKLGRVPFEILHIFKSKRFSNQTNSANDTTAHFSNHLLLDKQKQHAPCSRGCCIHRFSSNPQTCGGMILRRKKEERREKRKKTKNCSRIDNTTLHRGRVAGLCRVEGRRAGESLGEEAPSARKRRYRGNGRGRERVRLWASLTRVTSGRPPLSVLYNRGFYWNLTVPYINSNRHFYLLDKFPWAEGNALCPILPILSLSLIRRWLEDELLARYERTGVIGR